LVFERHIRYLDKILFLWPCLLAPGLRRGFAKTLPVMPSEPPQMGETQAASHLGHGKAAAAAKPLMRLV
jgi:hypothetical protein